MLIDTSVVIDPSVSCLEIADELAICTITLAELAFGLHVEDPVEAAARAARYHGLLATFEPIGFSPQAARMFGALCAAVRDSGRNPRPRRFDMMIAAVAAAESLPLVTRNPSDFEGIHTAVNVIAV